MTNVKNMPKKAINAAGSVLKGASSQLRFLLGNFTEGALIALFLAVSVVAVLQKHPNVALCALAASLGFAAYSESLALGIAVGLVLFGIDFFLRVREPFENPEEDEEDKKKTEPSVEAMKGGKKKSKTAAPDNADRAEFLELGKKYKLPSEEDDKDFHLDAGSTFMNAYKSLKPDQLAAMTKDTQDLMQTQKQLMSTLQTLKPLIMDGKEMMNTFQSYFGSSPAPTPPA